MQSITIKNQIWGERKSDIFEVAVRVQNSSGEKNMVTLTIWRSKTQETNILLCLAAVEHNAAGKKPAGWTPHLEKIAGRVENDWILKPQLPEEKY